MSPDEDIITGTRLFTIGNPSGLEYSVTSGIFSGYRQLGEQRATATDP